MWDLKRHADLEEEIGDVGITTGDFKTLQCTVSEEDEAVLKRFKSRFTAGWLNDEVCAFHAKSWSKEGNVQWVFRQL